MIESIKLARVNSLLLWIGLVVVLLVVVYSITKKGVDHHKLEWVRRIGRPPPVFPMTPPPHFGSSVYRYPVRSADIRPSFASISESRERWRVEGKDKRVVNGRVETPPL